MKTVIKRAAKPSSASGGSNTKPSPAPGAAKPEVGAVSQ